MKKHWADYNSEFNEFFASFRHQAKGRALISCRGCYVISISQNRLKLEKKTKKKTIRIKQ